VFLNEDVDGVKVTKNGLVFCQVDLSFGQPVEQTLDGVVEPA